MHENDNIRFREEMKARLKKFVLDLIRICQGLPHTQETNIIKNQLLRSGSSVYANYRAACRARSKAEFFSKLSIVVEEADETEMWLDLLIESKLSDTEETKQLYRESLEILKIMASARKNTKL
ncbi:four helix bundle protein [Maribellus sp. CM-23]|uniref:four helix bundle protein n=1 Tax=Maribellus sp. CM-23 TaxID=2781026 RepID=UPI001F3C3A1B|nr:four helix bundle protein [Maribellus sp. CM-23]MCE4564386.1 four helix bundle protein [Maribellus sp. CM-23]